MNTISNFLFRATGLHVSWMFKVLLLLCVVFWSIVGNNKISCCKYFVTTVSSCNNQALRLQTHCDPGGTLTLSSSHRLNVPGARSFLCCTRRFIPTPPPSGHRSLHTPPKLAWYASCANGLSCPNQRSFGLEDKRVPDYCVTHIVCVVFLQQQRRPCFHSIDWSLLNLVLMQWSDVMFSGVRFLHTGGDPLSLSPFYLCKKGPWSFLINV